MFDHPIVAMFVVIFGLLGLSTAIIEISKRYIGYRERKLNGECGSLWDALRYEKNHPESLLGKSLLGAAKTRHLTGRYTWEIHHEGAEYWSLPVVVAWARHRLHPEPFLAIRASHPRLVRQQLKPLAGSDVEISFSPRPAGS